MPKFQFFLPNDGFTRIQAQAIDSREPIFLSGVPGTGKTVVSIIRLKNAATLGKKVIIFTFGKLLRKTIEEKLKNNPKMPVDNIHHWMWEAQGEGRRSYLNVMTKDENITSSIKLLKSNGIKYDEILVDEGQDLSIGTYKILRELTPNLSISADNAQQINNHEEASTEEEILQVFPNLKKFELDEVFRSPYELYRFAIQFVPYNARANDPTLLERLKIKNSGADKPHIYLENSLNDMYKTIKDIIDESYTDNIGILFEQIFHVDECTNKLANDYELSTYHSQLPDEETILDNLKNIIVTTFKSAKGIEFDIVIIPYFLSGAKNIAEEYYVGVTRGKSQVHILAIKTIPPMIESFDKSTYKLIDNRG